MTQTPFAITLQPGSSHANPTGAWRTQRPVYVDSMPPCNDRCPAGENVQHWLYWAESGDYANAWRQIVEDNPFPAIMGRVCYATCESVCNRAHIDTAVGINSVERFLGDAAIEAGWELPHAGAASGKRVLIVGAGPSGLATAYHLRRRGHAVTLIDAQNQLGGMMRFGIPAYRLPRTVLDDEITRLLAMNIDVQLDCRVDDVEEARRAAGADAVYLAVGAQVGKRAYIPAGDSLPILDAVTLLHATEKGEPPQLGRQVVIYGGGDTAMDAARTAKRLGATDAVIVYRRTRAKMPAHDVEVEEAVEEGVQLRWLSTIAMANPDSIVVEKMVLDSNGFPQPTGEFETLGADSVVLALGQDSDLGLLDSVGDITVDGGSIRVDSQQMTSHAGIFAGGDATPAERTVTTAIGNGKHAARSIDAWLRGETYVAAKRPALLEHTSLNRWYYSDAPRALRSKLDAARRVSTFDEVVQGLDEATALFEARRCLSCGNCFECDNCYGVCPDNAVTKLDLGPADRPAAGTWPRNYEFNYDFCKGCGVCAEECPAGAIAMVPESV